MGRIFFSWDLIPCLPRMYIYILCEVNQQLRTYMYVLRKMKSPKVWSFELPWINELRSLKKVASCWVYLALVGKGSNNEGGIWILKIIHKTAPLFIFTIQAFFPLELVRYTVHVPVLKRTASLITCFINTSNLLGTVEFFLVPDWWCLSSHNNGLRSSHHQQNFHQEVDSPPMNNLEIIDTV